MPQNKEQRGQHVVRSDKKASGVTLKSRLVHEVTTSRFGCAWLPFVIIANIDGSEQKATGGACDGPPSRVCRGAYWQLIVVHMCAATIVASLLL